MFEGAGHYKVTVWYGYCPSYTTGVVITSEKQFAKVKKDFTKKLDDGQHVEIELWE